MFWALGALDAIDIGDYKNRYRSNSKLTLAIIETIEFFELNSIESTESIEFVERYF